MWMPPIMLNTAADGVWPTNITDSFIINLPGIAATNLWTLIRLKCIIISGSVFHANPEYDAMNISNWAINQLEMNYELYCP